MNINQSQGVKMNILFFGPNGSGKGTQGKILKDKYNIAHVESGAIFRDNIKGGTELGKKAKEYIDKGDLVRVPQVQTTAKAQKAAAATQE